MSARKISYGALTVSYFKDQIRLDGPKFSHCFSSTDAAYLADTITGANNFGIRVAPNSVQVKYEQDVVTISEYAGPIQSVVITEDDSEKLLNDLTSWRLCPGAFVMLSINEHEQTLAESLAIPRL